MDNIKDFLGAKIDAIIGKFDDIIGQISELIQDFTDLLDYIKQPFDSEDFVEDLNSLDFVSDFESIKDFESDLSSLLDIQEPSEYHLIIHFENIDNEFISSVGPQELDISFLHESTALRVFCWCIVCCGLIFIVLSGFPSMLRGDKGD